MCNSFRASAITAKEMADATVNLMTKIRGAQYSGIQQIRRRKR